MRCHLIEYIERSELFLKFIVCICDVVIEYYIL